MEKVFEPLLHDLFYPTFIDGVLVPMYPPKNFVPHFFIY